MSGDRLLRRVAVRAGGECLVLFLFVAIAVLFTWPLAGNLDRAVSDPGDPYLTSWILDWGAHALTTDPLHVYDAPVFHPAKQSLAFSENLIGVAGLLIPFKLAGAGPITLGSIALLLGFAFSGYAASVLVRVAGASWPASLIAGVLYAFVPFRFDHIAHVQFIWGGWLALTLAALLYLAQRPTAARAALFAAAVVMNGLTNIHHLAFAAVACGLTAILLAATLRHPESSEGSPQRFLAFFASAFLLAHLALVPVLLPYKSVSERYEMKRNPEEVRMGSASWSDWIVATDRSAVYGDTLASRQMPGEHRLFPGLLVLFLAIAALFVPRPIVDAVVPGDRRLKWARFVDVLIGAGAVLAYFALANDRVAVKIGGVRLLRTQWPAAVTFLLLLIIIRAAIAMPQFLGEGTLRQRIRESRYTPAALAALLWVFVGFVGSFGVHSFLHAFLYEKVLMFQSIRMPVRWAVIAYVGLSLLAALGVDRLLRGRSRRVAAALSAVLFLAAAYDVHPVARPWFMTAEVGGDVHRWLRDAPFRGAVVELPLTAYGENEVLAMLASTLHRRPIVNGASGFEPPIHLELCELVSRTPIGPDFVTRLRAIGCSIVVVHADRLGDRSGAVREWLARETAEGRLQFVRRFDHDVRGDYVFSIAGMGTDLSRLAAPARPDPSGRTPQESADAFIRENAMTYNASPFGYVEWPREGTAVEGALEIRGWALSPAGVDRVDALFASGTQRVACELVERQDINSFFPWYDRTRPAGFRLRLEHRPRGVRLLTDVQIEIHDRSGRTLRLRDVPITWKERR